MSKPDYERIYLLPEDDIWCWSDTPSPGTNQSSADAVEYVRADLVQAMQAERNALAAELEILAAFRDKVVGVMNNSQGVAGWHHNHAIATWDELFPVVPDIESPAACLAQVRADAVESAIKFCNHYMAFPVKRGNVADKVIAVDELIMYANRIRQGGAV